MWEAFKLAAAEGGTGEPTALGYLLGFLLFVGILGTGIWARFGGKSLIDPGFENLSPSKKEPKSWADDYGRE